MKRLLFLFLFLTPAGCFTFSSAPERQIGESSPSKNINTQEQAEQATLSTLLQSVKAPKNTKENYRISPSDLIEITVFRENELNRSVRVNQDGEISFPFVGTVKVGGKSIIEAERAIASGLVEFIKNPQITIFVKEYTTRQIYVLGEVKNPGAFSLPTESSLTVLEAISLAGGFTPVAAQDRTRVIRTDSDGKSQNLTIPVSAITKNAEKQKDIALLPSDVVFVPQSLF